MTRVTPKLTLIFSTRTMVGDGVKVRIPIGVRFYLIPNKSCGVGDGLLYRAVTTGGFRIFPFSPEREIYSPVTRNAGNFSHQTSGPMIKRRPQIVERIADDEREKLGDWLAGFVTQIKTIRLSRGGFRSSALHTDMIEVLGQGGRRLDNGINVALGPLIFRRGLFIILSTSTIAKPHDGITEERVACAASHASNALTISVTSQRCLVTPAAIAGVTLRVW